MSKKILSLIIAVLMTAGLLVGCSGNDAESTAPPATDEVSATTAPPLASTEAPDEPEPPTDADSDLGINYAERFSIDYMGDGVKLLTDTDEREYLLVPEGVDVPVGYEDKTLIRTPISSAFFSSTTHVGILSTFDNDSMYDTIAAVATEESSWTNPKVLERFASGQIQYIATDNWGVADAETVAAIKPQIVFTVATAGADLGQFSSYEEAGLICITVGEWLEKSNPASMEWIKFFGAFYNKDEEAAEIFDAKMARMDEVRQMASGISESERPVIAYALVYDGTVYVVSSESTTAKELASAGGTYYLTDLPGDGSLQIGVEEFFDKAKEADILIYTSMLSYVPDKQALLDVDPLFEELESFKNDQIYVFADDYYMNSAAVDEKFEDLASIMHPELLPGHTPRHFVKLPD